MYVCMYVCGFGISTFVLLLEELCHALVAFSHTSFPPAVQLIRSGDARGRWHGDDGEECARGIS